MILDITANLMRVLFASDMTPEAERPAVIISSSSVNSLYVDTITDKIETFNGRQIPGRLMSWVKSPNKARAFHDLFNGGGELRFGRDQKNNGYYFAIKGKEKKRFTYSGLYKQLDDVADDVYQLCELLGGVNDPQEINYQVMKARDLVQE